MALPDTYKQVERIGRGGSTQAYIDTGWVANYTEGFKVEMGARIDSGGYRYGLLSNRQDQNSVGCFFLEVNSGSVTNNTLRIGSNSTNSTVVDFYTSNSFTVGQFADITFISPGTATLNGTTTTGTLYTSANKDLSQYLMIDRSLRWSTFNHGLAISYFRAYSGGVLVRDMVPCYRKSDNVIGMYDLVNNQFYTNAGTGTFTKGPDIKISGKITHIYLGINQIRPHKSSMDFYYSDDNWSEYQSLVSSIGSVQFVDTGKRYRFNNPCYIGNRTIVNVNGSTFSKINVDTLTVISSKSSTLNGRIWYFGDNRILTRDGIIDFDGNMVTSFGTTYRAITPGLPGEVWANDNSYGMYKGIVNGDNITFTKVGTSTSNSGIGASPGLLTYGRLGVYQLGATENSTHYVGFVNASTGTLSTIAVAAGQEHMSGDGECMPDGKIYKHTCRTLGWGRLYKIGTSGEGAVGNQFGSSWTSWGTRFGKFLGNIVSGGMGTQNGTGNGYGSNNYFINSSGTVTLAQSNAFAYDTNIYSSSGCIDENGRIYPATSGGGSGVILKTDKTITDLHWRNPYLWR